jgi:RND superfamily putative drug exporter
VPAGQPSYDAYRYLEAHYPRDVTEAVTVTVDGAPARPARRLPARSTSGRRVVRGTPFVPAPASVAYANFALSEPALSAAPRTPCRTIRDLAAAGTADVLVSGNTAGFIDQKQSLIDHAPLVVAIVAVTTLILLFLLTGSVLLPLKTLVMNR